MNNLFNYRRVRLPEGAYGDEGFQGDECDNDKEEDDDEEDDHNYDFEIDLGD